MDSWIMTLTSPNHYTGWSQNLTVLTDLALNEKRPSLLSFHISWNIIPCSPILSLVKYFLSKRNPDQDDTPHWGQIRDILKTMIELMDKKKGKIGSAIMKKKRKRNQGVKGIQENFEKGYVKAKKKKWNERRMPINPKKGKGSFNWRKTHQMPKVNTKKSSFMSFGCVYDKSFNVFKKIRLIIHQRKSWIYIMTYVKRILIFEI